MPSKMWDSTAVRSESQMRRDLDRVLQEMRRVLDATRTPKHAADVPHTYFDKYACVERASQAALVAQLNILCDGFGLNQVALRKLFDEAKSSNQTVTLRFEQSSTCTYVDTIQRDEEDPHRVERRGLFGTTTYKRITRVIEHVWRYQVHWRISAYCGRLEDPANALELKRRSGYVDVKTRVHGVQLTGSGTGRGGKEALQKLAEAKMHVPAVGPLPNRDVAEPLEVDVTWLIGCVAEVQQPEGKHEAADVVPAAILVSEEAAKPMACEKGHELQPFKAKAGMQYTCDLCNAVQPTGSELRSCRECDFDVCEKCAAANAPPSGGDGQSAALALAVAAGESDPAVARIEFAIDRSNPKCHTPSNNVDVLRIKAGAFQLSLWTGAVDRALLGVVRCAELGGRHVAVPNLQFDSVGRDVFNPVLAFLTLESHDERAKSAAAIRDRIDPAVEVCAEAAPDGGSSAADAAASSEFLVSTSQGQPVDIVQLDSPAHQLSAADFDALLKHHRGSLRGKFQQLKEVLPPGRTGTQAAEEWPPAAAEPGIQTTVEGELRVACAATLLLWRAHSDVVHGIEEMLRSQLVQAIGSVVSASDFAKYMEYHKRKLFRQDLCPRPFSYAVRRPEHYPEGIVSVESDSDSQPITTTVVHRAVGHTMRLPLGASISLDMHGDHYIHAQVLHQFSTRPPAPDIDCPRRTVDCAAGHGLLRFSTPRAGFTCDRCRLSQNANSTMFGCRACDYDACAQCFEYGKRQDERNLRSRGSAPATAPPSSLIARARQFSSFVLLLGTLNAADEFNPVNAIILQNKDEVKIPLILTTIPTPKEFARQVSSLSDEQQAFAKAYRKMQLAGTLFAVAVVQIKPNLERLLNLPKDALTKEVKMCQDLMRLFVEHQIPSDLLSYGGEDTNAPARVRVAAVKQHIANIDAMLTEEKIAELKREAELAQKQRLEEEALLLELEKLSQVQQSFDGDLDGMNCELNDRMMCDDMGDLRYEEECEEEEEEEDDDDDGDMDEDVDESGSSPMPSADESAPTHKEAEQETAAEVEEKVDDAEAEEQVDSQLENDDTALTPAQQDVQDYTKLPSQLNASMAALDVFDALRPTKIAAGDTWTKMSQDGLLSDPKKKTLYADEQRQERSRAFDLLDALSRSGGMALESCTLHVMVAATHCFDRTLMDTLVKDNVDPITRAESSELIMAATLHGEDRADDLVREEMLPAARQRCRHLFA